MGRRVPLAAAADISEHPCFSISLLLAGMVAAIAMVTTLCGVRFRRRSSSENHKSSTSDEPEVNASGSPSESEEVPSSAETKELPLPPAAKQLKEMYSLNNRRNLPMRKSASTRNIISTMSMKLPRSLSMARNREQEEKIHQKMKGKLSKQEDSVWKKTIILGEKCKVPDEEEVTIYDGKGNRVSAYHPKTPSSLPVSRQNSHIDMSAIP